MNVKRREVEAAKILQTFFLKVAIKSQFKVISWVDFSIEKSEQKSRASQIILAKRVNGTGSWEKIDEKLMENLAKIINECKQGKDKKIVRTKMSHDEQAAHKFI